jgi:hypothetical protein
MTRPEPRPPDARQPDERLAAWVDGELPARERERMAAELRVNAQLRADLDAYERTVATLRAALQSDSGGSGSGGAGTSGAAAQDFAQRVLAAVDAGAQVATPGFHFRPGALLWGLCAAAGVLAGVVWLQDAALRPERRDRAALEPAAERLAPGLPQLRLPELHPPELRRVAEAPAPRPAAAFDLEVLRQSEGEAVRLQAHSVPEPDAGGESAREPAAREPAASAPPPGLQPVRFAGPATGAVESGQDQVGPAAPEAKAKELAAAERPGAGVVRGSPAAPAAPAARKPGLSAPSAATPPLPGLLLTFGTSDPAQSPTPAGGGGGAADGLGKAGPASPGPASPGLASPGLGSARRGAPAGDERKERSSVGREGRARDGYTAADTASAYELFFLAQVGGAPTPPADTWRDKARAGLSSTQEPRSAGSEPMLHEAEATGTAAPLGLPGLTLLPWPDPTAGADRVWLAEGSPTAIQALVRELTKFASARGFALQNGEEPAPEATNLAAASGVPATPGAPSAPAAAPAPSEDSPPLRLVLRFRPR